MHPIKAAAHLPYRPGVYLIKNESDGKVYVGSSKDVRVRCLQHIRQLNRGDHHAHHLQAAWLRDGAGAFTFHLLEECTLDDLVATEERWMLEMEVLDPLKGYNTFAASPTGRGYTQTPEHVAKRFRPGTNRALPQHAKDAVAASNRSRVWTEEQREAARIRLAKGKAAISKEVFSKKLSESMKGRVLSDEHKKKLSHARKKTATGKQ